MRLREMKGTGVSTPAKSGAAGYSRLQPSEPLHMTTRAASRAASVASSSQSEAASANASRRHSLAGITQVGGVDVDSQRPAKRVKLGSRSNSARGSGKSSSNSANESPRKNSNTGSDNQDIDDHSGLVAENQSEANQTPNEFADAQSDKARQSIENALLNFQSRRGGRRKPRGRRGWRGRPAASTTSIAANQEDTPRDSPGNGQGGTGLDNESPDKRQPGEILKRLPGRRRAPHADPYVEADLRRQLELKVAYRAVAKALKPILAELASRTAKELDEDPQLCQQYDEYDEIQEELDRRLAERLAIINFQLKEEENRLAGVKIAQEQIALTNFTRQAQDLTDDWLLRCQNKALATIREVERVGDEEATDDEDGEVVPHLHGFDYRTGEQVTLPDGCDSRSRFFIETAKAWDYYSDRSKFRKVLQEADPEAFSTKPQNFAVYDGELRRSAIARYNVTQLYDASQEVEEAAVLEAQKKANAVAGLQLLATTSHKHPSPPSTSTKRPAQETPRTKIEPGAESEVSNYPAIAAKKRTPARSTHVPPGPSELPPPPQPAPLIPQVSANAPGDGPPQRPSELGPPFQSEYEVRRPSYISNINLSALPQTSPVFVPEFVRSSGERNAAEQGLSSEMAARSSDPRTDFPAPKTPTRPPKERKRPGPRPHYTYQTQPVGLFNHQGNQQEWSPFTNTMGPPTFLPHYIKPPDRGPRSGASTSENIHGSATAPLQSSQDYRQQQPPPDPRSHQRTGSMDQRVTSGPGFQPIAPAGVQNLPAPAHSPYSYSPTRQDLPPPRPQAKSPDAPQQVLSPTTFLQPHQINPFYHLPQHQTSYHQPNPFYTTYQPAESQHQRHASPPPPPPPQQVPPRSAQPPHWAPPPVNYPPQQHSYAAQNLPNYTPLPTLQPAQTPPQGPLPTMQHHPGQLGHQRILPATLDPSRQQSGPAGSGSGSARYTPQPLQPRPPSYSQPSPFGYYAAVPPPPPPQQGQGQHGQHPPPPPLLHHHSSAGSDQGKKRRESSQGHEFRFENFSGPR